MSIESDRRQFIGRVAGFAGGVALAPVFAACGSDTQLDQTQQIDGPIQGPPSPQLDPSTEIVETDPIQDLYELMRSPERVEVETMFKATAKAVNALMEKEIPGLKLIDPETDIHVSADGEGFIDSYLSDELSDVDRADLETPEGRQRAIDKHSALTTKFTGNIHVNAENLGKYIDKVKPLVEQAPNFEGFNLENTMVANNALHEIAHAIPIQNGINNAVMEAEGLSELIGGEDEISLNMLGMMVQMKSEGELLAEFSGFIEGSADLAAEYYARKLGMPYALTVGYNEVSLATAQLNADAGISESIFAHMVFSGNPGELRYVLEQYGESVDIVDDKPADESGLSPFDIGVFLVYDFDKLLPAELRK